MAAIVLSARRPDPVSTTNAPFVADLNDDVAVDRQRAGRGCRAAATRECRRHRVQDHGAAGDRGPPDGRSFDVPSAAVSVDMRAANSGYAVSGPPRYAAAGIRYLSPNSLGERVLAEQVIRHVVRRTSENLFAVVAGKQPGLMIDGLAEEVRRSDFRLGEVHRIGDHGCVRQVIAVTHEELDERRLIALRQSVASEPALLEMGGLHFERIADEVSGRESHPRVRRVRWRMRTSVHPDHPVTFEGLVVPVNGGKPLRVGVSLLPTAGVADGTDRVRSDVAVALMLAQGHA